MYFGATLDIIGFRALLGYIGGNALSSVGANEADTLNLRINANQEIEMQDNGRGLPVFYEFQNEDKKWMGLSLAMVFQANFFRNPGHRYHQKYGFVTYLGGVLNALCEWLYVETVWKGNLYSIKFGRSQLLEELVDHGPTSLKGTKLRFLLDQEVWGGIVPTITDLREIARIIRQGNPDIIVITEAED